MLDKKGGVGGFKVVDVAVDQKTGRMVCGLLKGKEWRDREMKKKKGKNM